MTTTLPTSFTRTKQSKYQPLGLITEDDYEDVRDGQNYVYSRSGTDFGGVIFDPEFTTSSVSQVTDTDTTNGLDLDIAQFIGRASRPMLVSGSQRIVIEVSAIIRNCELEMEVENLDSGTVLTSVTLSDSSGDTALVTGNLTLTLANAQSGGEYVTLRIYPVGAIKSGANDARIYQIHCREAFIDDEADLPDA